MNNSLSSYIPTIILFTLVGLGMMQVADGHYPLKYQFNPFASYYLAKRIDKARPDWAQKDDWHDCMLHAESQGNKPVSKLKVNLENFTSLCNNQKILLLDYFSASPLWEVRPLNLERMLGKDRDFSNVLKGGNKAYVAVRQWVVPWDVKYGSDELLQSEVYNLDVSLKGYVYVIFNVAPESLDSLFEGRIINIENGKSVSLGCINEPYVRFVASTNNVSLVLTDRTSDNIGLFSQICINQIERDLSKEASSKRLSPAPPSASWLKSSKAIDSFELVYGKGCMCGTHNGRYGAIISVNPGERGMTYFKCYEKTTGKPLQSPDTLKYSTSQRLGWSNCAGDKFVSFAQIQIDKKIPGGYYNAQLELWFTPESGAPDKLLVSKTYKLWQMGNH